MLSTHLSGLTPEQKHELVLHYEEVLSRAQSRIRISDSIHDMPTGMTWKLQGLTLEHDGRKFASVTRVSEASTSFTWLVNANDIFDHAQKGDTDLTRALDRAATLGAKAAKAHSDRRRLTQDARHLIDKWKKEDDAQHEVVSPEAPPPPEPDESSSAPPATGGSAPTPSSEARGQDGVHQRGPGEGGDSNASTSDLADDTLTVT